MIKILQSDKEYLCTSGQLDDTWSHNLTPTHLSGISSLTQGLVANAK